MKKYLHFTNINNKSRKDIKSILEKEDHGFKYNEHFIIEQLDNDIRVTFTEPQQEYLISDLVNVMISKGYNCRC